MACVHWNKEGDFPRINGERDQRKRLIRFLIGLDESYSNIRGQVLLMQPLPIAAKAYTMVRQEEKQRECISPKTATATILNSYSNNYKFNAANNPNSQRTRLGGLLMAASVMVYTFSHHLLHPLQSHQLSLTTAASPTYGTQDLVTPPLLTRNGWKQKELQALEANKTWELILLPPEKIPIGCKWVYRIKFHVDGSIERYKARLVAKGFNQKEGIDYKETFAPIAKMVSVRALLAVATTNNWLIEQMDINNVFLYGDLNEEVYLTLPQGLQHLHPPNIVYKLKKSLYALLVYVDDILIAGNHQSTIIDIKKQLHKQFSIKDLGPLHYYLRIEILRNSHGLVQRKYALELLKCGNVLHDKPVTIPIDPIVNLNLTDGKPLPDHSYYRTLVGKLIYLTITRPDISFVAQLLSKFLQAPRTTHMKAPLKVLRYIKLCPGQGLHFPTHNNLRLTAYCDSDWATCPITRRSVTGYAIFLARMVAQLATDPAGTSRTAVSQIEFRRFEILENSLEALKVLKNSLEVLNVLHSYLEVLNVLQINLELQETHLNSL
ncbi:retrovirus-related pol polyprotein from transposon RE1 [Tanacetum coccineum]|uniref:Retrovirus-related pol polyprotein from transposon RE1 n=1 Tax=Tanacetum coccineum TaxID=301880 RepID=A0ABQ4Y5B1_9ASTR